MARVLDIAGAVFLANAGWMLFQRVTARNVTRGTVVGYEETRSTSMEPGTEETTFYQPIVEFTDEQGRPQLIALARR